MHRSMLRNFTHGAKKNFKNALLFFVERNDLTRTFSNLGYCLSGALKKLISNVVAVKTSGDSKCKLQLRLHMQQNHA